MQSKGTGTVSWAFVIPRYLEHTPSTPAATHQQLLGDNFIVRTHMQLV